jgi:hypothetical protein
VVDRAALGQLSSGYFDFPCHPFIPLIAPKSLSSSITQVCYNRPIIGLSYSGLGSTATALKTKERDRNERL